MSTHSSPAAAVIRNAVAADSAVVTALLVAQQREHDIMTPAPAIAGAVRRVLGHPEAGRILVATLDEQVVGVAALSFAWPIELGGQSVWLEELYVLPALRGAGIGRQLLDAVITLARDAGALAIDLEVVTGHERAARLYERAGFRISPRTRWVLDLS